MAAYSAVIQGAAEVFVIDHIAERLALAEKFGATGVDSTETDPVEHIKEATGGEGVDRGVEAVGYQAHDAAGNERSNMTMNALVDIVRPTGGIGFVGVFVLRDPGGADELAKNGQMAFDFGKFFLKGQTIGTGQANVKNYNRYLRDLIHHDRATPSRLVSHNLGLADAQMPTGTSTIATQAGRRSFSIRSRMSARDDDAGHLGPRRSRGIQPRHLPPRRRLLLSPPVLTGRRSWPTTRSPSTTPAASWPPPKNERKRSAGRRTSPWWTVAATW